MCIQTIEGYSYHIIWMNFIVKEEEDIVEGQGAYQVKQEPGPLKGQSDSL